MSSATRKIIVSSFVIIFAGIVLTFIAFFHILGTSCNGDVRETKLRILELTKALEIYLTDCHRYPTTEESLRALRFQPSSCKNWGPDPYQKFPNVFLGCKVEDYINLQNQNHHYNEAALSLATIFLTNCLSIQRLFSNETYYPPLDSWGHKYIYKSDGLTYEIISLGKDGLPGGNGLNADLSSAELRSSPEDLRH